jgi:hypothetical protein
MGEINWLFAIIYTHSKLWIIRANKKPVIGQEMKRKGPSFQWPDSRNLQKTNIRVGVRFSYRITRSRGDWG